MRLFSPRVVGFFIENPIICILRHLKISEDVLKTFFSFPTIDKIIDFGESMIMHMDFSFLALVQVYFTFIYFSKICQLKL